MSSPLTEAIADGVNEGASRTAKTAAQIFGVEAVYADATGATDIADRLRAAATVFLRLAEDPITVARQLSGLAAGAPE